MCRFRDTEQAVPGPGQYESGVRLPGSSMGRAAGFGGSPRGLLRADHTPSAADYAVKACHRPFMSCRCVGPWEHLRADRTPSAADYAVKAWHSQAIGSRLQAAETAANSVQLRGVPCAALGMATRRWYCSIMRIERPPPPRRAVNPISSHLNLIRIFVPYMK